MHFAHCSWIWGQNKGESSPEESMGPSEASPELTLIWQGIPVAPRSPALELTTKPNWRQIQTITLFLFFKWVPRNQGQCLARCNQSFCLAHALFYFYFLGPTNWQIGKFVAAAICIHNHSSQELKIFPFASNVQLLSANLPAQTSVGLQIFWHLLLRSGDRKRRHLSFIANSNSITSCRSKDLMSTMSVHRTRFFRVPESGLRHQTPRHVQRLAVSRAMWVNSSQFMYLANPINSNNFMCSLSSQNDQENGLWVFHYGKSERTLRAVHCSITNPSNWYDEVFIEPPVR